MNPAELFRHETDALKLPPGDTLFREGQKGEKTYVVLEGENGRLAWPFRARDRRAGSADW